MSNEQRKRETKRRKWDVDRDWYEPWENHTLKANYRDWRA